jgi:hypothetical protein
MRRKKFDIPYFMQIKLTTHCIHCLPIFRRDSEEIEAVSDRHEIFPLTPTGAATNKDVAEILTELNFFEFQSSP